MSIIKVTYAQFLKTLSLLHLALMLAQLALIGIIFVLVEENSSIIDIQTKNIILFAVPMFILLTIIMGRFFYQQQLVKIRLKKDLKEKLISYRNIQILNFAFAEAGAFACFIASFLSQNFVFVYGSIGVLIYFLSLRPGKTKLEKELALDFSELDKLSNPTFIVSETDTTDID
jgi:hypothetical protein